MKNSKEFLSKFYYFLKLNNGKILLIKILKQEFIMKYTSFFFALKRTIRIHISTISFNRIIIEITV
jgi:hypothetical protein